jgi:hypothetical protein
VEPKLVVDLMEPMLVEMVDKKMDFLVQPLVEQLQMVQMEPMVYKRMA